MTRYRVIWTSDALDQLAEIWLSSAERSAVSYATTAIDRQLSVSPLSAGSELHEELRDIGVPPLRAMYTVDEPNRSVEIVAVGRRMA